MNTSAPPPRTAREWVGRNVREHRRAAGLTLDQLSERLAVLGFMLDRSQLSKIETGRTNVDVEKLLALADCLEVTPERLLRDPVSFDRRVWRRLMQVWERALWERARQEHLAEAMRVELDVLAERMGDEVDPVTGYTLTGWMDDTEFAIDAHEWRPKVERVAPDRASYDDYLAALASGDVEAFYESRLTPWTPATVVEGEIATTKKRRRSTG